MQPTVYIETSIPSFYYEVRKEPEFVVMRNWSRAWWQRKGNFVCSTSEAVFNELEDGHHPNKQEKIVLLQELNLLEINDEIEEIVEVYIANYLMPKDNGVGFS